MNGENLIKKSCFALTIIALLMMVCLSACTVSSGVPSVEQASKLENIDEKTEIMNQKNIQELNVENSETDTKAPEGILKGNFLVAWERVIPGDFVEKVTDSSEFTEGFRNIRLIYSAEKAEEIGGVIHCFSYGKEMAEMYLNMGFYLGIGGVVTFNNAKKLKEVVEYAPLERLVTETDCPYLAPVPNRGKRNDSSNLVYVVDMIAELKGMEREIVEQQLFENAKRLYRMQ